MQYGHCPSPVLITDFGKWFFFPHFGLAAPAIATGIGWLMANLFWLICLTRLRRQSLLQA